MATLPMETLSMLSWTAVHNWGGEQQSNPLELVLGELLDKISTLGKDVIRAKRTWFGTKKEVPRKREPHTWVT